MKRLKIKTTRNEKGNKADIKGQSPPVIYECKDRKEKSTMRKNLDT